MRTLLYALLLLLPPLLLPTGCAKETPSTTAARARYERALSALEHDSVQAGELLLNEAIREARSTNDLHTLYLAQQRLAESLAWGNSGAALAMARQALETYERSPDDERNHVILLDYAGTYAAQKAFNEDGPFDDALTYTRRAYALADSLGDPELISQTLTSLANISWAQGKFPEALDYGRRAVAAAPPSLLAGAQQVLARCYASCDSLAEAEAVYRSMDCGTDVQAVYIVQSSLTKLALRRGDIEAAEEAVDSAFAQAEQLYYDALAQKDAYYQSLLAQQGENERLRYHRRTLWMALAGLMVLAFACAFIIYYRMRLGRRLVEAQRRQVEAQRERLRQRDGMVEFLKDFILQRSEVIRRLGNSGDRHVVLTDRDWAEVERTLDVLDANRFALLRRHHPELREDDLRLCILIRLRLSNRVIGNVYAITVSAVQHRKLRLKKDVFGETSPDVTLEQVIDALPTDETSPLKT